MILNILVLATALFTVAGAFEPRPPLLVAGAFEPRPPPKCTPELAARGLKEFLDDQTIWRVSSAEEYPWRCMGCSCFEISDAASFDHPRLGSAQDYVNHLAMQRIFRKNWVKEWSSPHCIVECAPNGTTVQPSRVIHDMIARYPRLKPRLVWNKVSEYHRYFMPEVQVGYMGTDVVNNGPFTPRPCSPGDAPTLVRAIVTLTWPDE